MTSQSLQPTLSEAEPAELTTRSGLELRLRPVTPQDGRLVAEFFDGLSPEDMRFRFLSSRRHLPPDQLAQLIGVDHQHSEHLLGFDAANSLLVASMMIVADRHLEDAEVAIAVRADYKGRGIGWTLLKHAADLARERGIRRLRSIESRSNLRAIEVERTLGFHIRDYEGDATLAMVEAELN